MPDICDLVLDDHETFRRRFGELDGHRDSDGAGTAALWGTVADLLELHAAAEEAIFYPALLDTGASAVEETEDALSDHDAVRQAVGRADEAEPGSHAWWEAVDAAREQNSDHMAEEERGAIADLRVHAPDPLRHDLGTRWLYFHEEHAGLRGVSAELNRSKGPD